jgi:ABC-2 type transport system permease protein
MTGAIFRETLRRQWRQVLYWGAGLGLYGLYITSVINDVDFLQQYAQIMESMPPALLQMFGVEDTAVVATPAGFISFGFFGYSLLILAVFAVVCGMNITANEEEDGIMDVLLSAPIPRWRIIVEKFLAYALMTMLILAVSFVGLLIGLQAADLGDESGQVAGQIFEGTINVIPSMLLMIAFTMFMGTVLRRRGTAVAISSVFIVASYFINFLGELAGGTLADVLRGVSLFSYYNPDEVMLNGLNAGNIAVLLLVTAALFAGSLFAFQRRDIGV